MVMNKPPPGLKPKHVHDQERLIEICGAIARYYQAGLEIDIDWVIEYNELTSSTKEQKPSERPEITTM